MIILLLLAILILIFVLFRSTEQMSSSDHHVPMIIWTYWNDEHNIPEVVQWCMESWRKSNPTYVIHLLHKSTYSKFVTIPKFISNHSNFNDSNTRFADLLRLYLLEKHGGIWVDSSIFINKPFEDWLFIKQTPQMKFQN